MISFYNTISAIQKNYLKEKEYIFLRNQITEKIAEMKFLKKDSCDISLKKVYFLNDENLKVEIFSINPGFGKGEIEFSVITDGKE